MTDTNQLPPHTITINDHPEPHIMQWSDLELAAIKKYAEGYALKAHAQVQGEPVLFIHPDTFAMNNAHVGAWKPGHELTGYIPLYTHAAPSVPKDDQIAALVNKVRDIARMFHDHQSLRERIAIELVPALKAKKEQA